MLEHMLNPLSKKYHFDEIQIVPQPTEIASRKDVNVEISYITKHSKRKISGCPVIVANLDTTGTVAMAMALAPYKMFVAIHKYLDLDVIGKHFTEHEDDIIADYSFFTIGLNNTTQSALINSKHRISPKYILIDVANGYSYKFLDFIKKIRDLHPNSVLAAGNVCTPEGVENVIKAGADMVKCGIANGSVCDTKNKAGVGYPQFSVAYECGQAANELNALCISDGGVRTPADICKALAAGSHFVMCGGLFAGYDECEGEWEYYEDWNMRYGQEKQVERHEKKRLKVYGMSSKTANDKYNGGLKEYRSSEGKETWVPYKGKVEELAKDIRGSLASCCSYCNTSNLENLYKNAKFVLC